MRRVLIMAAAIVTVSSIAMAAPTVYDQVWGDRVEERLCAVEAEVGVESVECVPPTTTTSTTQPTTTTTQPTTTTTAPPGLVIPPTQEQTIPGFKDNDSFRIMIGCINSPTVTCDLNSAGKGEAAVFDYLGHGMPYLYPEAVPGGHNHAWWEDGDREGYRCSYGFMWDQHPNPFGNPAQPERPGEFIARFSIVRAAGYGRVNDTYMDEGEYYYDGTKAFEEGREIQDPNEASDCLAEALEPDFDYDAYQPHGPDDIRVGLFRADGAIGDIRDFTKVELKVPGHFEFISLEDGRAQIVFILGATGKASHAIYYDVLGSGRIAVEVNGTTIGE